MISQDTTLSINAMYRLQWEAAQDCYVLLYPEGMIQLNGPAAEILSRCNPPCTLRELIDKLSEAFPDAPTLEDDVNEFIQTAHGKGWLNFDKL